MLGLSLDQSAINPGDQVNLSGSFTDPQSNIEHTVTINWGDGVGSSDVTTLSVPAGQTTFQADPQTYNTAGSYTITVTVSGADGSTMATTNVTVNPVLPQVTIGTDMPVALETGGQNGEFTVTLSAAPTSALTVYYQVSGTAVNGQDYQLLSGSVTFPAGYTTELIDISAIDEGLSSDSSTVVITLCSGTGYQVVTAFSSAMVTIVDNDAASGNSGSTDADASSVSRASTASSSSDDSYEAPYGLIFYGSDGARAPDNANSETVLDGETIPVESFVNPNGLTTGTFLLWFDSSQVVVSWNKDGGGGITPNGGDTEIPSGDVTEFNLTPGDPQFVYVQEVSHPGDLQYSAASEIAIWQVPMQCLDSDADQAGTMLPPCPAATKAGAWRLWGSGFTEPMQRRVWLTSPMTRQAVPTRGQSRSVSLSTYRLTRLRCLVIPKH